MASLTQTFGSLSAAPHDLQISMLGWHKVGTCQITINSQFEFAASGNYNALGHSGDFDFTLTMDDKDPAAASGPCTILNAGKALAGTYTLVGTTMTFSDGVHTVTASTDPGGVTLAVGGYPKARIA
jgi:hypothetical protein